MSSLGSSRQKIVKRKKSSGKQNRSSLHINNLNGTKEQSIKSNVDGDSQEVGRTSQSSKLNADLYK